MPIHEQSIPFGAALRRQRLAAGLSLGALARRVHYSKSHLSKIETGRRMPSLHFARLCDVVLQCEGTLAELAAAAKPGPPAAAIGPIGDQWVISVDGSGRGGFGAVSHRDSSVPDTISPLTWAMPPATEPRPHRLGDVGSFRVIFNELRRLGQAMAPAALLPVLIAQIHSLRMIAKTTIAPVRTEALLLAGRFAEYAGWLAQEAGDDVGALWWTDRAIEFADGGDDTELAAYALVRRGLVTMYRYDARETIALAERAQAARCSARVRGLAALREAQGHALAGGYGRCQAALDRATVLLQSASAPHDGRPVLGTTTVADPVAMVTGWCLHDLGRPQQAIELLDAELAAVPDYAHRTRARIGVRYSLALVAAGELEQGCAALESIIDAITLADSATVRVDLRRLAQDLNRHRTNWAVRSILPRLVAVLSASYR